jgi:cytochrome b561
MTTASLPTRYNNTAIVLHWLLALLIIGLLVVGFFMPDLPKTPLRKVIYNYHKSFGLIVFALVLFRIYWRLTHAVPAPVPGSRWQVQLAHYAHVFIYALILVVPGAGLLASAFNHGFNLFVFHWEPVFAVDKDLAHQIMGWHGVTAYVLAGLLSLHVIAFAWHQFVQKDGLIRRLWFTPTRH